MTINFTDAFFLIVEMLLTFFPDHYRAAAGDPEAPPQTDGRPQRRGEQTGRECQRYGGSGE